MYREFHARRFQTEWPVHDWVAEISGILSEMPAIEATIRDQYPRLDDHSFENVVRGELVAYALDRMHELAKAHYQGE